MRNADWNDVKKAQQLGKLEPGIMYNTDGELGTKYHYKDVDAYLVRMLRKSKGYVENFVVCERLDGRICVVNPDCFIGYKAKGPSHTPKKPKRKPVKGTKPWTKIPYKFEDVEVGDTVAYTESDGTIVKYLVNEKTDEQWEAESGGASYLWKPSSENKAHIIKPYKEPVKGQEKRVSNTDYYQIGDRFEIVDPDLGGYLEVCMLCRISSERAMLITKDGNRWVDNTCSVERDARCRKEDVEELIGFSRYTYKKI